MLSNLKELNYVELQGMIFQLEDEIEYLEARLENAVAVGREMFADLVSTHIGMLQDRIKYLKELQEKC